MNKEKKDTCSTSNSATTSKGTKRKSSEDGEGTEYLRRKHNFIRSTIRTDYQPDICKDYKETGFCGFGDSCKFLHDRTDYKHGWQLDQEYAQGRYGDEDDEKYLIKDSDNEDDENLDSLQCAICREPYTDPIETKCKHYFCSKCADKECIEKCYSCSTPTSGIFKNASKIIKDKLASKKIPTKKESSDDDTDDSSDKTKHRNPRSYDTDSEDFDD